MSDRDRVTRLQRCCKPGDPPHSYTALFVCVYVCENECVWLYVCVCACVLCRVGYVHTACEGVCVCVRESRCLQGTIHGGLV